MANTVLARQKVAKGDLYTNLMKAIYNNPALFEILPEMAFFDCTNTTWSNIFTPKRLELLRLIKQKNPRNISELALLAKRNNENVYRDLKELEKFDLVHLEKNGREAIPHLTKDAIVIIFRA